MEVAESIDAQDVTKQYVDQQARLRNLRAQEQQYLGILRKAATVKDTLEVSDKLNEVRGAIEERQAEFEALSKQVETVAINITLRADADRDGVHLLRQGFEFCLPLLDRATHFIQLVTDFERVFHGRGLAENAQILPPPVLAGFVVALPDRHIAW